MNEPLVSIALQGYTRIYAPGDELRADFQIDAVEPGDVESVEASVLWYTEGKGDEDLGVHHFERFTPEMAVAAGEERSSLHELRSIKTTLPPSPLSYSGRIVKICWCVRVRAFLTRGREAVADQWFQLGTVASPAERIAAEVHAPAAVDAAKGRGGNGKARRSRGAEDERASELAVF
jgi:hypothetical protein